MPSTRTLHKALEGALYSLAAPRRPPLRQRVEGILDRILAAQQKDGFLISYFIVQGLDKKWDDLRLEHQMYNAGHFFEMAVEHHRLTGDPKVLDAAKRFADHIDGIFGPGKRYDVDGHQEVELALVKLYRATGERRYLELAKFFLDERGYAHGMEHKPLRSQDRRRSAPSPPARMTAEQRREYFAARLRVRNGRMQDHKPVVEQHEAVGHAVRAGYMYSAMADIVRFMDAPGYERALDRPLERRRGPQDVSHRRRRHRPVRRRGFRRPVPAAQRVGLLRIVRGHRPRALAAPHEPAQGRGQVCRRDGTGTVQRRARRDFDLRRPVLLPEPAGQQGGGRRSSWIGLSCCPTNLARIIPQVGGLAYARGKQQVVRQPLRWPAKPPSRWTTAQTVKLAQQTDYPWDGRVRLTVTPEQAAEFTLCLRIPGLGSGPARSQRPVPLRRCEGPAGRAEDQRPGGRPFAAGGRLRASAAPWQAGDVVELDLPMPVQRVYAHEKVTGGRRQGGLDARPDRLLPGSGRSTRAWTSRAWPCRRQRTCARSIARGCWAE